LCIRHVIFCFALYRITLPVVAITLASSMRERIAPFELSTSDHEVFIYWLDILTCICRQVITSWDLSLMPHVTLRAIPGLFLLVVDVHQILRVLESDFRQFDLMPVIWNYWYSNPIEINR
jgi:hypothetical protein